MCGNFSGQAAHNRNELCAADQAETRVAFAEDDFIRMHFYPGVDSFVAYYGDCSVRGCIFPHGRMGVNQQSVIIVPRR